VEGLDDELVKGGGVQAGEGNQVVWAPTRAPGLESGETSDCPYKSGVEGAKKDKGGDG
jgi:hypothetical protein